MLLFLLNIGLVGDKTHWLKESKQLSKMMLPIIDVKHFAFLFLSIMF